MVLVCIVEHLCTSLRQAELIRNSHATSSRERYKLTDWSKLFPAQTHSFQWGTLSLARNYFHLNSNFDWEKSLLRKYLKKIEYPPPLSKQYEIRSQ